MDNVRNTWESLLDDSTDNLMIFRQELEMEGRKSKKYGKENTAEQGAEYPFDFWYIISLYIKPESIGTFARICKGSYHITTTPAFWFRLYKLYYRYVPNLPKRLQPQCMVRQHGLRACVIRMLHFSYFPMGWKYYGTLNFRPTEPHALVNRQCQLMWHKKYNNSWYFYFKLKEVSKTYKSSITRNEVELLEMLEDIDVNPDEGCKVLRVTCSEFSLCPSAIGLILHTVRLNLIAGYKGHCLHLEFGPSPGVMTMSKRITLNHVVRCKVLDWWHAQYPHDSITENYLPRSDSLN